MSEFVFTGDDSKLQFDEIPGLNLQDFFQLEINEQISTVYTYRYTDSFTI